MEYLSEVLKILDGALRANASMAGNYAGLLADKLEANGERTQARLIRERLARAPTAIATAQDMRAGGGSLPVDSESKLHTVDVSHPVEVGLELVLPLPIQRRIDEFVQNIEHAEKLRSAAAFQPNRLLFFGPPGTGKTQSARYVAARLSLPLLTVRCDTLVSSLLGQTSRNIRKVFDFADTFPCILFLDEFDALAGARGNERDVGELQRVVIALLQNMDALSDSTILLAATNHEQLLDPAVWRRFSFQIAFSLPDTLNRAKIWKLSLGGMGPVDAVLGELAEKSEGLSGAVINQIGMDSKRTAVLKGEAKVAEHDIFRRLGLTMALSKGISLSSQEDEMRWLKQLWPRKFSLRALSSSYDTSIRQVMKALRQGEQDGSEVEQ